MLLRHVCDGRATGRQPCSFGNRGREVFFKREASAGVGFGDDSLQVDLRASRRVGEFAVELTNSRELFVDPVAARRVRRETKAVGKEHRVTGDFLARVQILREQGRRHDESVSGVRETFASRAVLREFACRIQVDVRQITHGIGVLCIAQSPQHDRSRVAGAGVRLGVEIAVDPDSQQFPLFDRRLAGALGGHLAIVEHLGDFLPDAGRPPHVADRGEPLKIELALHFLCRMTIQAESGEQRPHVARIASLQRIKRLGLGGPSGRRGTQGQRKNEGEVTQGSQW